MQWPESRCFSMQSASNEEYLKITYAIKGKFTHRISEELRPGKKIWLKMAYGNLFQTTAFKDHCVFIAGGTGITAFCRFGINFRKPSLTKFSYRGVIPQIFCV